VLWGAGGPAVSSARLNGRKKASPEKNNTKNRTACWAPLRLSCPTCLPARAGLPGKSVGAHKLEVTLSGASKLNSRDGRRLRTRKMGGQIIVSFQPPTRGRYFKLGGAFFQLFFFFPPPGGPPVVRFVAGGAVPGLRASSKKTGMGPRPADVSEGRRFGLENQNFSLGRFDRPFGAGEG